MKRAASAAMVTLLCLGVTGWVAGATWTQWIGTGSYEDGQVWDHPGYWHAGVPDINKWAEIANGGTAHISGIDATAYFVQLGGAASGTLVLHSNSLTTVAAGGVSVGYEGIGVFEHLNGTLTTSNGELSIGYLSGSNGQYNLKGGQINASGVKMGNSGYGLLRQSAGTQVTCANLTVGQGASGEGRYEMAGGDLGITSWAYVGTGGPGTFVQDGGTVQITHALELGSWSNGDGRYELNGPADVQVSMNVLRVGYQGKGTFVQTGGTVNVTTDHWLPAWSGGDGRYELGGTGQLNTKDLRMVTGESVFVQTGGTHTVQNNVEMGDYSSVLTRYELGGAGLLDVTNDVELGAGRAAEFVQSGGTLDAARLLINYGSTYTMSGGSIVVGDLDVGVGSREGSLLVTGGPADITVSNLFRIGWLGTFEAVPGTVIHMTGTTFENNQRDAAAVAGLENVEFIFEGGAGIIDTFEVGCADRGEDPGGGAGNFGVGALTIGGSGLGQVRLVDTFNNSGEWPDVLYVGELNMGAGSYLDLGGRTLYYERASINAAAMVEDTVGGGSLKQVPEPATLLLLAAGLGALVARKRRT